MPGKKRFHRNPRGGRPAGEKSRPSQIRAMADPVLKKAFARIGVPAKRPFRADAFQEEAVAALGADDVLVTAPTGSGKTWIAEQVISRTLKAGGSAWYASPLKALTNSKYQEFAALFGADTVGILTGDRKENPDAAVITGTTEILRNQLYDAMHHGETLQTDVVILDEAHFLGDPDRGVVWEEIMIYLPVRVPLLMLSATIGNADQIAAWLERIRCKPCRVVAETRRPVPLYPLFFHPTGTLYPLTVGDKDKKVRLHKKVYQHTTAHRPMLMAPPRQLPPFGDILKVMKKFSLLPAIFFMKSRADCDQALTLAARRHTLPPERRHAIAQRVDTLTQGIPHAAEHRQRYLLEHHGVGAHHSGQLPAWKIVLENLMTEGLLDAIFATSTVAAGVNFPARTIVFLNSDKFNGIDFSPLTPTEFHQMTGRAGRRGMDNIGFAVVLPGRFMDVGAVAKLVNAPPSGVMSQIHINFSMVLNLLLSHTPPQVEELLSKSFAAFQIEAAESVPGLMKKIGYGQRHLAEAFDHHLQFLVIHGYATAEGRLTDDGLWASKLRVDHPLLLAEGFRHRLFPDKDPALLAAIMAVFVNERETNDTIDRALLPEALKKTYFSVRQKLLPFMAEMSDCGFATRPMYLRPAVSIHAWCAGKDWEFVQRLSEMEEGNLVMLMLRTADHLRHVRSLKDVFPEAAETAAAAIDLILREPVTTELGM
ncbi:MAG: DEAD/DEAH box helicase [Pseudomonadota bacterium]